MRDNFFFSGPVSIIKASLIRSILLQTASDGTVPSLQSVYAPSSLVALTLSIPVYKAVSTGWQLCASIISCKGGYVREFALHVYIHRLVQKHMYLGMYTYRRTNMRRHESPQVLYTLFASRRIFVSVIERTVNLYRTAIYAHSNLG